MKSRLLFLLKYAAFWLLLFLLGKVVFLLYEHNQSFELPWSSWIRILQHGFRLDLSATGYIVMLPCLVLALTSPWNAKTAGMILGVYTFLMIPVFLLITLVDLEAYKYWGTRLDSAPLRFLSTPGETLASSNLVTLVIYFSAFIVFTGLLNWIYIRYIASSLNNTGKTGWKGLIFLFMAGSLILPIRGGFNVSVVNTGSAFFHSNPFANHAAINVLWNFGHSLVYQKESANPYVFYRNADYDRDLKQLYAHSIPAPRVISPGKPNIVLVILESFTAKLVEPLGGAVGITPNFNELCRKGILFSKIYAADSRTDKGLAAILSGYPVLEAIPILKYPERTQHLPFLSKSLMDQGYHSSFYYGGDIDFANMRSYVYNGQFNRIIAEEDFPAREKTGKWGVPDQYVFNRFITDIPSDSGSWFHVMLSLSNHEPFEIPVRPKYGSDNLAERFYSSASYADSCLGNFINRFRASGMWDKSILIMVADHGTRVPDFSLDYEPRKFHIPILITGGAVIKDSVVSKIGSQADLAVTLLGQLGLDTRDYILGKDLLAPDSRSFVLYSYKNGMAMLTDSTAVGVDLTGNGYNFSSGPVSAMHAKYARTQQQYIYCHYLGLAGKKIRDRRSIRK